MKTKRKQKRNQKRKRQYKKVTLKNKHYGRSIYSIKYAIHCKNKIAHTKTVKILKKIGFHVFRKENYGLYHTFLELPKYIKDANKFMLVIVINADGNNQKILNKSTQGPHLGFVIKNMRSWKRIVNISSKITKTIVINKPDEKSLFIELSCGEIIEFSVRK